MILNCHYGLIRKYRGHVANEYNRVKHLEGQLKGLRFV